MANALRVSSNSPERDFTAVLSDDMVAPLVHAVERAAPGEAAERRVWVGKENRVCRAHNVDSESTGMRAGATIEAMQDAMEKGLVDASHFCTSCANERHSQKVRSGRGCPAQTPRHRTRTKHSLRPASPGVQQLSLCCSESLTFCSMHDERLQTRIS
jgi:hypothetical protein